VSLPTCPVSRSNNSPSNPALARASGRASPGSPPSAIAQVSGQGFGEACPTVDRVRDGGRAIAIEEGLTAYIFTMAAQHSFFASLAHVPPSVLKTCAKMTAHLEVAARSTADWHAAILAGYAAFRNVVGNRGGVLTADLGRRTLSYDGPPSSRAA